jgi:hypothetical protein
LQKLNDENFTIEMLTDISSITRVHSWMFTMNVACPDKIEGFIDGNELEVEPVDLYGGLNEVLSTT